MGKYKIIALIGEAGSGKDYIMKQVLAAAPGRFNEIVSCTTRPKREGEIEGINYYYLTPEQFADKLINDEMLEATVFNNWCYGTSYDALRSDILNIGVFNPAGIYALLDRPDIELTVYKVVCKDKTRLLRQLNRENDPNVDEIVRRYKTDKDDFFDLEFEYIELPNEAFANLEDAVKQIVSQYEVTGGQGQNKLNN